MTTEEARQTTLSRPVKQGICQECGTAITYRDSRVKYCKQCSMRLKNARAFARRKARKAREVTLTTEATEGKEPKSPSKSKATTVKAGPCPHCKEKDAEIARLQEEARRYPSTSDFVAHCESGECKPHEEGWTAVKQQIIEAAWEAVPGEIVERKALESGIVPRRIVIKDWPEYGGQNNR